MKGTEMCWSCLCEAACECQPEPNPKLITDRGARLSHTMGGLLNLQFAPSMTTALWLREWFDLVHTYTDRCLTQVTDRLPAVAGLATWLQPLIKARYLFGLWETQHLRRQLLWQVYSLSQLPRHHRLPQGQLKGDYAPSWSWASCWGSVVVPSTLTETTIYSSANPHVQNDQMSSAMPLTSKQQAVENQRPHFAPIHHKPIWTIDSVDIKLTTTNAFGPGTGVLVLRSLIVPVDCWTQSDAKGQTLCFGYVESKNKTADDLPIVLFSTKTDGYIWRPDNRHDFEDKPEWYHTRRIYFVFAEFGVLRTKDGELDFCGLLLELIGDCELQPCQFRRLGYAENVFRMPEEPLVKDGLRRETWERWQELGKWDTIALI